MLGELEGALRLATSVAGLDGIANGRTPRNTPAPRAGSRYDGPAADVVSRRGVALPPPAIRVSRATSSGATSPTASPDSAKRPRSAGSRTIAFGHAWIGGAGGDGGDDGGGDDGGCRGDVDDRSPSPLTARLRRVKTSVSDLARKFALHSPRPGRRGSATDSSSSASGNPATTTGGSGDGVSGDAVAGDDTAQRPLRRSASASAGTHLIVPPHQSSRLNLAIMQHRIQAKLDLSDPGAEGRAVSAMTARSTASVGSRTATGSNGGYATPLTTQQTPSATSRSCEKKDVEHGVVPGLDKDPSEYVFEDSLDPLPTYASQAYTPAPQYQLTPSDHCEAAPAPIFGRDEAARLHIENEVFETLQRQNRQHNPPSYLEATAHDAELERRRAAKPCDAWARLHGDVGVSWAGRGGRPGRPGRSTRSSRPSRQRRAAGTAALEPPVPSRQSRKREILAEDMRCERYFWVPDAPGYFRPMPCTRYSKGGEKDKDKDKGWLRRRLGRSGWTVQPQQRPADGGARSGGRRRSMSPYPRGGGKSAPSPLSPSRREAAAASRGGSRGRDEGEAVVSTREVGEGSPGIRRSDDDGHASSSDNVSATDSYGSSLDEGWRWEYHRMRHSTGVALAPAVLDRDGA